METVLWCTESQYSHRGKGKNLPIFARQRKGVAGRGDLPAEPTTSTLGALLTNDQKGFKRVRRSGSCGLLDAFAGSLFV